VAVGFAAWFVHTPTASQWPTPGSRWWTRKAPCSRPPRPGRDGDYAFDDVPEGEYTIIASGYPPAASALRVGDGDQNRHDVELGYGHE